MSRTTVRAAVANWLTPDAVAGLANIYQHPAKVTSEGEFSLPDNQGLGGLVFIQLESQHEKRIALGGSHSGIKWRQYQVVLVCLLRSTSPLSEDAGAANDLFIEAITARLQADRTLGTEGQIQPVFQAGEGSDIGGDDIEVQTAFPRPMKAAGVGITQVFSTIRFQACEALQT